MIRVRLEFRNAKVREVFEILRKILRKFKVWRYGEIIFVAFEIKRVEFLLFKNRFLFKLVGKIHE